MKPNNLLPIYELQRACKLIKKVFFKHIIGFCFKKFPPGQIDKKYLSSGQDTVNAHQHISEKYTFFKKRLLNEMRILLITTLKQGILDKNYLSWKHFKTTFFSRIPYEYRYVSLYFYVLHCDNEYLLFMWKKLWLSFIVSMLSDCHDQTITYEWCTMRSSTNSIIG